MVTPEYTTKESPDGIVFTILDGAFSGCSYNYGTVSITEPTKTDGNATLNFDYKLINDATKDGDAEGSDELFNIVGQILETVIAGLNTDSDNIESVDYNDIDSELEKVL